MTFVDAARDERTELSAVSLENAAAKIANALRAEFELEPGALLGLHLPQHWQRAAWCAGAWTAGCVVVPDGPPAQMDLLVSSPERAESLAAEGRSPALAVVSMHPFGLPLSTDPPAGAVDVTLAVRQQPDAYLFEPPGPADAALRIEGRVMTQEQALDAAAELAARWGLVAGGRLLVGPDLDALDAWLACVAVPLVADASVVLLGDGPASDALIERERVTATAGSSASG